MQIEISNESTLFSPQMKNKHLTVYSSDYLSQYWCQIRLFVNTCTCSFKDKTNLKKTKKIKFLENCDAYGGSTMAISSHGRHVLEILLFILGFYNEVGLWHI